MNKPTARQIAEEIEALKALRHRIPAETFFGDDNQAALQAQIDFLEEDIDTTADEFDELNDHTRSAVNEAENWKEGSGAKAPSDSWKPLVK